MSMFFTLLFHFQDVVYTWYMTQRMERYRDSHDTESEIEESVFHLLNEYFDKHQPFHIDHYEKNPSIGRHRFLLTYMDYSPELTAIYDRLLRIAAWYRGGKFNKQIQSLSEQMFDGSLDIDEYKFQLEKIHSEITTNLLFVIEHRRYLWS